MKATPARLAASLGATVPAAKAKYVPTSGSYPKGFSASGVFVGVKPGNTSKPDLAIVTSDRPCAAAAVFTKNKFQAAPVTYSRQLLQRTANAGVRSIVINSGNANAVTGAGGLEDAARMASTTDQRVGAEDSTLVMSTGVIGQR
jgi:glutamate N-acetyltransferase / amino-acid N-acetyltransferase